MILLSTTNQLCQGDDFIRDGVMRLLEGIVPVNEGCVWINRTGCNLPGNVQSSVWKVIRNMPHWPTFLSIPRAFVMAGSPGWLKNERVWYSACIHHEIPVWLIGVGGTGGRPEWVAEFSHLIQVATTRDELAARTLSAAGVESQRFLDPAFYHPSCVRRPPCFDIVLTYRYKREPKEPPREEIDEAYRKVWRTFNDRIDLVVVHEPSEIEEARRVFGVEPFFDHDYRRYIDIYARTKVFIGGRLHGAIPTLASGGCAHLIYNCDKTTTLDMERFPVQVHKHADVGEIEPDIDPYPWDVREIIAQDFGKHRAYLIEHLGDPDATR